MERLLHDQGYASLWAMRWSDLLRNEQKVMSPQGASGWHAWMAQQVALDRPVNEFVSEMITTIEALTSIRQRVFIERTATQKRPLSRLAKSSSACVYSVLAVITILSIDGGRTITTG